MDKNNPVGNIYVAHRAIATVAYHAAFESYGVVGFAARNLAEGIAQLLVKDPTLGVDVQFDGITIKIDMHVIVEYGTRIKEVADSVSESVRYHVEKTVGIPVSEVNIHIRGLRISNPD